VAYAALAVPLSGQHFNSHSGSSSLVVFRTGGRLESNLRYPIFSLGRSRCRGKGDVHANRSCGVRCTPS